MELTEIIDSLGWEEKRPVLEAIARENPTVEAQEMLIEYQVKKMRRILEKDEAIYLLNRLDELHELKKEEKKKQEKSFTSKEDYDTTYTTVVEGLFKINMERDNKKEAMRGLEQLAFNISRRCNPSVSFELLKSLYEKTSYNKYWCDNSENKNNSRKAAISILDDIADVALKMKDPEKIKWVVKEILDNKRQDYHDFSFPEYKLVACAIRLTKEAEEDWGDEGITSRIYSRFASIAYEQTEEFIKEKRGPVTFSAVARNYEIREEFEKAEKWYISAALGYIKDGRCEEAFKIAKHIQSEEYLGKKIEKVTSNIKNHLKRAIETYERLAAKAPEVEEDENKLDVMKAYHGHLKEAMDNVEKKETELEEATRNARKTWPYYGEDNIREMAIRHAMEQKKYERAHNIALQIETSSGPTKRTQTVIAMYQLMQK
jgi:hypothetical protein